jgi:hypothetical protein
MQSTTTTVPRAATLFYVVLVLIALACIGGRAQVPGTAHHAIGEKWPKHVVLAGEKWPRLAAAAGTVYAGEKWPRSTTTAGTVYAGEKWPRSTTTGAAPGLVAA